MTRRLLNITLVLLLVGVALGAAPVATEAEGPALLAPTLLTPSDRSRFGVNSLGSPAAYDLGQLNIGWYMNWGHSASPVLPSGVAYAQTVRIREDLTNPSNDYWPPDWNELAAICAAQPGALWLIGNEPDHRGQDNCLATEYADRYYQCYTFIKANDATARVAPAGLVQATPLRLHWLNDVLTAYQASYGTALPADAWQIHAQILCETCGWGATYPPGLQAYQMTEGRYYSSQDAASVPIFIELVTDFRTWMKDNGYRNTPLILSEYGVLQPSGCGYLAGGDVAAGDKMVRDFMTGTFDFFLGTTSSTIGYPADGNRLVQQWAWYSLNARMSEPDCSYLNSANGSLYEWDDPTQLTQFGQLFKAYTDNLLASQQVTLVGQTTPQRYQAAGDASWVVALTLTLTDTTSGGSSSSTVTTDPYGVFTTTVTAGTYHISVKGAHTLENVRYNVTLTPAIQLVGLGTLIEGDANNDNAVGILDYSMLYSTFDSSGPAADFNQDGIVNILDYSLLYANYDRTGPIAVTG